MTTTSEPPAERFARLYEACYLPVLRFIARRSGADGAEDLAHETFVTAWRRLDAVPLDEDGARAWLFTVARNIVLNAQRARRRPTELSVELDPEAITDASAAGDESLWAARLAVAEAWRALAPGQQEVLALAVWEGLPSADACLEKSDVPGAHVRASERRGDTVGLVAGDDDDTTVWCLARMPEGSTRVSALEGGVSGGAGAVPAADPFTDGGIATFSDAGPFGIGRRSTASFVAGRTGQDVVGLRITDSRGHEVDATVDGGRDVAWWPGDALTGTTGDGGPTPELSYRVTLSDGTVLDDAHPVLPR